MVAGACAAVSIVVAIVAIAPTATSIVVAACVASIIADDVIASTDVVAFVVAARVAADDTYANDACVQMLMPMWQLGSQARFPCSEYIIIYKD